VCDGAAARQGASGGRPKSGVCAQFIIVPVESGKRSEVRIQTEWRAKPGLAGFMERLLNPLIARLIYKVELAPLAAQVGERSS
jgi:hypothetical protein